MQWYRTLRKLASLRTTAGFVVRLRAFHGRGSPTAPSLFHAAR